MSYYHALTYTATLTDTPINYSDQRCEHRRTFKHAGIHGQASAIPSPTFCSGGYSNHIVAYVRSISGPAVEKPPQNNDIIRSDSFGYRILCVNAPVAVDANITAPPRLYNQQLTANLHELRLTFLWPQLPNGNVGPGRQTFRTMVAGQIVTKTAANARFVFLPVPILRQRHQRAVNLKFPISNLRSPVERRVRSSAFTRSRQHISNLPRKRGTPNGAALSPATRHAFTLVEVLVVVAGAPATNGDAFIGKVTTDPTRVTAVVKATRLFSRISVTAPAAGNFSFAHNLGRAPLGALIYLTSGGALWFQSPTMFDATNLFLVASAAGLTAQVEIW